MPVSVDYQWEETATRILIRVFLKHVKKVAIDVYIADAYVKVNCAPFLWEADLKHFIDVEKSRYGIEENGTVRVSLVKVTEDLIWHQLKPDTVDKNKREESKKRAEQAYSSKMDLREQQKVKEEKRFFSEHWELEKQQRAVIETKVKEEREAVSKDLSIWGESIKQEETKQTQIIPVEEQPVRSMDTTTVTIDFTPASQISMPSRTRSDEEIYRRSRYKPKSLEDTPFFFKDRGDKQFKNKDLKGAIDSYSEALKRDTCFLAALTNRSVAYLQMHDYKRCIEDCTLTLNMLQSTPASNTTGDRFRHGMMKAHSRRSAAYGWSEEYEKALHDIQMAIGYGTEQNAEDLNKDMAMLKEKMKELGLLTEFEISDVALKKGDADRLVATRKFQEALTLYDAVITEREDYWDAVANRVVCLLCLKRFKEASSECDRIIERCQAVAASLVDGGVGEMAAVLGDSDDDDDDETNQLNPKRQASNVIKQSTSHVYALLKAYIRKGAACAGLKDYRSAYEYHELALRIMPYDNDLRTDVENFRQKLQMNNVIAAATTKPQDLQ